MRLVLAQENRKVRDEPGFFTPAFVIFSTLGFFENPKNSFFDASCSISPRASS
jgi:hypothetical protein